MSPKDIIFMVRKPPRFGYLEVDPPLASPEESANHDVDAFDQFSPASGVTVFDQEIINEGRLHYIQSISNQVISTFCSFTVTEKSANVNSKNISSKYSQ
jgi:hypothetical protein